MASLTVNVALVRHARRPKPGSFGSDFFLLLLERLLAPRRRAEGSRTEFASNSLQPAIPPPTP